MAGYTYYEYIRGFIRSYSVDKFSATQDVGQMNYWEWIQSITRPNNNDEVSRF